MNRHVPTFPDPKAQPRPCPPCCTGEHVRCTDTARWPCSCAADQHDPTDSTAAAARLYHRSDLDGSTVADLAAEWRARYARAAADTVAESITEALAAVDELAPADELHELEHDDREPCPIIPLRPVTPGALALF